MILEILRKFFQPIMPLFRLHGKPTIPTPPGWPTVDWETTIEVLEKRGDDLYKQLCDLRTEITLRQCNSQWTYEQRYVVIPLSEMLETGEQALDRLRAAQLNGH